MLGLFLLIWAIVTSFAFYCHLTLRAFFEKRRLVLLSRDIGWIT